MVTVKVVQADRRRSQPLMTVVAARAGIPALFLAATVIRCIPRLATGCTVLVPWRFKGAGAVAGNAAERVTPWRRATSPRARCQID
jgi:hypothetical protein